MNIVGTEKVWSNVKWKPGSEPGRHSEERQLEPPKPLRKASQETSQDKQGGVRFQSPWRPGCQAAEPGWASRREPGRGQAVCKITAVPWGVGKGQATWSQGYWSQPTLHCP